MLAGVRPYSIGGVKFSSAKLKYLWGWGSSFLNPLRVLSFFPGVSGCPMPVSSTA
jgi:hypothetical protein